MAKLLARANAGHALEPAGLVEPTQPARREIGLGPVMRQRPDIARPPAEHAGA
jgi:hypothetical protein